MTVVRSVEPDGDKSGSICEQFLERVPDHEQLKNSLRAVYFPEDSLAAQVGSKLWYLSSTVHSLAAGPEPG